MQWWMWIVTTLVAVLVLSCTVLAVQARRRRGQVIAVRRPPRLRRRNTP
ncbi:hypothetical protein [Streptomyces boninensis]